MARAPGAPTRRRHRPDLQHTQEHTRRAAAWRCGAESRQRGANGHFARAADAAGEDQVRDVGARQQPARRARRRPARATSSADGSDDRGLHRLDRHAPAFVGGGIGGSTFCAITVSSARACSSVVAGCHPAITRNTRVARAFPSPSTLITSRCRFHQSAESSPGGLPRSVWAEAAIRSGRAVRGCSDRRRSECAIAAR